VGSRLRLTGWERELLTAIGAQLSRARAADLAAAQRREPANDRVKQLVARFGIQSRYGGSICVDNDAAVRAAKEQLWQHQRQLQAAIGRLEARTALPSKATACGCRKRRCGRCGGGYATENERVMKRRRLDALSAELADVQRRRGRAGTRSAWAGVGWPKLATTHAVVRSADPHPTSTATRTALVRPAAGMEAPAAGVLRCGHPARP
jgi:hypothetical protein